MRAYASILLGVALLSTVAVSVPAQAPDWTQFRLSGNEQSATDILNAIHAFDPSIDMSQVQQSDVNAPLGSWVALDSSGVLHPIPIQAGTVYACGVVGAPFGFGPLNLAPPVPTSPPGCGSFGFHPGGISTLAEANLGVYGSVFAFGFSSRGFGFVEIFCQGPGVGMVPNPAPVPLPLPIGCRSFSYGAPISSWSQWIGYQFGELGVSVGAAF